MNPAMMPPQPGGGGQNPLIQLLMALAMEEQGEQQPGMGQPGMPPGGGQDPMAMIMAMLGQGGGMPPGMGGPPGMGQEPMPPNSLYR